MLSEKYRPKKCSDVIGQAEAVKKLFLCIQNNKHALVYGSTGTGKTSSVYAVANELNCEVIELNSSDFRSKKRINEIVGNSVNQKSLFSRPKIILIDELDGLSGQKDRGCIKEITKFVAESRYPLILVCNDLNKKFSKLKKNFNRIEFSRPDFKKIFSFLKDICEKEKIIIEDGFLVNISCNCNGDVRAALNDLNVVYLGDREKESVIQDSLKLIFKSISASSVLNVFDNINEDLDECFLWLDENIPKEYSGNDIKRAYDNLSKADIFRKRILRHQYYRFLSYINIFLTAGISSSKENISSIINNYKQSFRILKTWIAKQKNIKRDELTREIACRCHCSAKKMRVEMPYLDIASQNNKPYKSQI